MAEEEVIVLRQHTLLPLRATRNYPLPRALGSAPVVSAPGREWLTTHRRRPVGTQEKTQELPISYLPVDCADVLTEEGCQYLCVASDGTSKVTFAELPPQTKRVVAAEFPQRVLEKLPYKVPTVLPDIWRTGTPPPH